MSRQVERGDTGMSDATMEIAMAMGDFFHSEVDKAYKQGYEQGYEQGLKDAKAESEVKANDEIQIGDEVTCQGYKLVVTGVGATPLDNGDMYGLCDDGRVCCFRIDENPQKTGRNFSHYLDLLLDAMASDFEPHRIDEERSDCTCENCLHLSKDEDKMPCVGCGHNDRDTDTSYWEEVK